jgi:hypothetical protein
MRVALAARDWGVLPSVLLWGQDALDERTATHLAFDLAVHERMVDELDRARRRAERKAQTRRGG